MYALRMMIRLAPLPSGFNNLSNYPVIAHSFRHSLTHSVIEFVFVILSPGSLSPRSNDGEFSSGS
jgi:hypothetical protein